MFGTVLKIGVVDTFCIQCFINSIWRNFMKKIFIIALLASFITTASAKSPVNNFVLQKANVSDVHLITGVTQKWGGYNFRWCVRSCQEDYNNCRANASTPWQVMRCNVRGEACYFNCGGDGPLPGGGLGYRP